MRAKLSTDLSELDLARIERRVKGATPGPWKLVDIGVPRYLAANSRICEVGCVFIDTEDPQPRLIDDESNAEFLVHAREDIEKLLEENKKLRSILSSLKKSLLAKQ